MSELKGFRRCLYCALTFLFGWINLFDALLTIGSVGVLNTHFGMSCKILYLEWWLSRHKAGGLQ